MLDMSTGICSCEIGRDGSPCKHQFIIWSNQISESQNFLPYFNAQLAPHLKKNFQAS